MTAFFTAQGPGLWAFDCDGVLAKGPPASPKKWGLMKGDERKSRKKFLVFWYANASIQWNIPGDFPFHVISARKDEPDVRRVTEDWLRLRYGERAKAVHLLRGSRSIENVIEFKAGVLREIGATHYVEDNPKVCRGVKKAFPDGSLRVYQYDPSRRTITEIFNATN